MSLCTEMSSLERIKVDGVAPKVSPRVSGGRRGGKVLVVPWRKRYGGRMLKRRVGQGEVYRLRRRQAASFLRVKQAGVKRFTVPD